MLYLDLLSELCILLIFLDYHKKRNIHLAIIHLILLLVIVYGTRLFLAHDLYLLLWLAGLAPLLIASMLLWRYFFYRRR